MAVLDNWTNLDQIVCEIDGIGNAVASNYEFYIGVDTNVSGNVAANSIPCQDGLTKYVFGTPINGTLVSFDEDTGDFEFSPDAGFTGIGKVPYTIQCDLSDGNGFQNSSSGVANINVGEAEMAEITTVTTNPGTTQIFVNPETSIGWYLRVRIDSDNDGDIDFTGSVVPNLDLNNPVSSILVNFPLKNGDKILLDSSNDAGFASFDTFEWIIPDSQGSELTDTSDLTNVQYTINGIFDPSTTQRNFTVTVRDCLDKSALGIFNIIGVNANPSGSFDATALGITADQMFSLEICPYDEIGQSITCEELPICVVMETENFTIAALNTFPSNLAKLPSNLNHIRVMLNGVSYFSVGKDVAFSIAGQALTWNSPNGIDLDIGDEVTIIYPTLIV